MVSDAFALRQFVRAKASRAGDVMSFNGSLIVVGRVAPEAACLERVYMIYTAGAKRLSNVLSRVQDSGFSLCLLR